LANNVDAFWPRPGSLERYECGISKIERFAVVLCDSSQHAHDPFNIGEFSEGDHGLNAQSFARPVNQNAPNRARHECPLVGDNVTIAEHFDRVRADLRQFVNIDCDLQQKWHDTCIGELLDVQQSVYFGRCRRVSSGVELRQGSLWIASKGPVAVRLAKASVTRAFEGRVDDGIEFERNQFFLLFSTHDAHEGMHAFIEKRQPTFEGN
jgi:enoyl-CoA hydratase/carnithine racemase